MSDLQTLPAPHETKQIPVEVESPDVPAVEVSEASAADATFEPASQEAFQAFIDAGLPARDKETRQYQTQRYQHAPGWKGTLESPRLEAHTPEEDAPGTFDTDMLNKLEENATAATEKANSDLAQHIRQEDAKDQAEQPRIYNNGDVAQTAGEVIAHQTLER